MGSHIGKHGIKHDSTVTNKIASPLYDGQIIYNENLGAIICSHLENCSSSTVTLIKFMLLKQLDNSSPEEGHLLDSRLLHWSFNQPDSTEGVQSFFSEKRPPSFRQTGELPDFPWWRHQDVRAALMLARRWNGIVLLEVLKFL